MPRKADHETAALKLAQQIRKGHGEKQIYTFRVEAPTALQLLHDCLKLQVTPPARIAEIITNYYATASRGIQTTLKESHCLALDTLAEESEETREGAVSYLIENFVEAAIEKANSNKNRFRKLSEREQPEAGKV